MKTVCRSPWCKATFFYTENDMSIVEEKKDEEEPVVASVNLMVKIAQKLDLKKNYKLADKFINILRKYNV